VKQSVIIQLASHSVFGMPSDTRY